MQNDVQSLINIISLLFCSFIFDLQLSIYNNGISHEINKTS